MFEKRLAWFTAVLIAIAGVIVARLVQIQVVHAAEYRDMADRLLTRPADHLAAPRGTIYDRDGRPLVTDEPTFNVCVHYAAMTSRAEVRDAYIGRVARALVRQGVFPPGTRWRAVVPQLREELAALWPRLGAALHISPTELMVRADEVCARVERIQAAVQRRSPEIAAIAEEDELLPVVENLDNEAALPIRLEMEDRPWLRVLPGSRRVTHDDDLMVHLLGRMGAASPQRIAADLLRGDDLRGLRAGDRCGVSGIERLAETSLRGRRGRIVEGYDRRVLERVEAEAGHAVSLTIDLDAQRAIYDILQRAIEGDPKRDPPGGLPADERSGAAAVVIDVATREVLALVSYPTYSYATYSEQYDALRRDRPRDPLMFRAVRAQYAPGSICKAITLIGGLTEGVVTPQTRFHCTGFLLPEHPDRFRCWIYRQNAGVTHDMTDTPEGQDAASAVRNSCNIYFFNVGGLLGPDRLCEWFGRFGLGHAQGTGLIEESLGIVPSDAWLSSNERARPRHVQKSDAWNFAIGQGEVTVTPLQAANVAASIASGYWAPVRLATDDTGEALGELPLATESFKEEHLQVLRSGMWRVVNERGGTGTAAKLDMPDWELCGKTGSAQTVQRVTQKAYTVEWPDGRREELLGVSRADVLGPYADDPPRVVSERIVEWYPELDEGETLPAHAWFMGFTQPHGTPRGGRPTGRVLAISVIIEFGGSGGRTAGPVAKEIAEYLLGG